MDGSASAVCYLTLILILSLKYPAAGAMTAIIFLRILMNGLSLPTCCSRVSIFGIETAKSSVKLNYTLDAYWYDDRDSVPPFERAASDYNYVGQTGDLQMRYQAFPRLQFGLDDTLRLTRDAAQCHRTNSAIRLFGQNTA